MFVLPSDVAFPAALIPAVLIPACRGLTLVGRGRADPCAARSTRRDRRRSGRCLPVGTCLVAAALAVPDAGRRRAGPRRGCRDRRTLPGSTTGSSPPARSG